MRHCHIELCVEKSCDASHLAKTKEASFIFIEYRSILIYLVEIPRTKYE